MPIEAEDTGCWPAVPVVAGIDVATATVRVVCVDAHGTLRATGAAELPPPVRGPAGGSEQDAHAWWPATAHALRQAVAKLPGRGREVLAVASCATSGTLVPAGSDGVPLGPASMYDDRRAASLNAAAQRVGEHRWARLGLSVGPTAALGRAAWHAARLRGSSVTGPAAGVDHRTARLLHTPDLLGWRLTGHPVATDWSHALKTGYDPLAGEWATEVFDALGVPVAWLPTVRRPGTEVGTVCSAAAEESGLPVGCSVRSGMTDGCAGQLATGAVHPGQFVGVLGTTYVLKGVSGELVTDPDGAVYSHRHPDGWWLPGGASNTGGGALADVPVSRLAALDAAADARGPASCVTYPLRREGERFPFVAGAAHGFTVGAPVDEADRHRAVLEGVAFVERLALERVAALGLPVRDPVFAAGGGIRSGLWNRLRATALGRPLRVVRHAESAFGAALLAATGTLYPDLTTAATAMVGAGDLVWPVAAESAALTDSYGRFTTELRCRGWL